MNWHSCDFCLLLHGAGTHSIHAYKLLSVLKKSTCSPYFASNLSVACFTSTCKYAPNGTQVLQPQYRFYSRQAKLITIPYSADFFQRGGNVNENCFPLLHMAILTPFHCIFLIVQMVWCIVCTPLHGSKFIKRYSLMRTFCIISIQLQFKDALFSENVFSEKISARNFCC